LPYYTQVSAFRAAYENPYIQVELVKNMPSCPCKRPERIERGFTLIETMIVLIISIILVAFAVPKYLTIRDSLRAAGDVRSIADATGQAKLRAASDFTHARVYADLNGNTFQLQTWYKAGNSGSGCWVVDSDSTNTCITYTASAPSGAVVSLSQGDTFGFGALTTGPTVGQTTIGQAGQCLDNSGSAIGNTACIVFNSRGIPINAATLAPVATDALYLTNGTVVDGVTISATGSLQTWSASANASLSNWYSQ
jgi:prepilin-type N-terminal cleavage/methylation domain-containing protein